MFILNYVGIFFFYCFVSLLCCMRMDFFIFLSVEVVRGLREDYRYGFICFWLVNVSVKLYFILYGYYDFLVNDSFGF